jgi:nucleoprotein TPR
MASRVQRSGKTFTEVYADNVRLQDEYGKKLAEYDRMARTLASNGSRISDLERATPQSRVIDVVSDIN